MSSRSAALLFPLAAVALGLPGGAAAHPPTPPTPSQAEALSELNTLLESTVAADIKSSKFQGYGFSVDDGRLSVWSTPADAMGDLPYLEWSTRLEYLRPEVHVWVDTSLCRITLRCDSPDKCVGSLWRSAGAEVQVGPLPVSRSADGSVLIQMEPRPEQCLRVGHLLETVLQAKDVPAPEVPAPDGAEPTGDEPAGDEPAAEPEAAEPEAAEPEAAEPEAAEPEAAEPEAAEPAE